VLSLCIELICTVFCSCAVEMSSSCEAVIMRIVQRFGYELVESGYEMSEPGYERSMGTKRLVTPKLSQLFFLA